VHGPDPFQRQEARHRGLVRQERDRDRGEDQQMEDVEAGDHEVPQPSADEKHERAAQLERHDAELAHRQQAGHPDQQVRQPGTAADHGPGQRRPGQPLDAPEPQLRPRRQEIRRHDSQLGHPQRPAAPFGRHRVAVPGPAGRRQHSQRDEQPEPVVVDLAVAHRDDHPFGVPEKDGPAQRAREPTRGGGQRRCE
jgi:hypothetical protein